MQSPYDYTARKGVRPISWNDFHGLTRALAIAIAQWQPQIILPIGRGGYYPGTLLAHILQAEIYPVRLSRREYDVIVRATPKWLIEPPPTVKGLRVLVVDEVCSTGETLAIVKNRALELGAEAVRAAVLFAHSPAVAVPDYIGLITDELLINPWDREIFQDGAFHYHPEYIEAISSQVQNPESFLPIVATPFIVDKAMGSEENWR